VVANSRAIIANNLRLQKHEAGSQQEKWNRSSGECTVVRGAVHFAMWTSIFFLLGSRLMLLEAQIVSKMALLFGTTWV